MLSHWTPVWFLANWPRKRVGLASYSAEFAETWGRRTRNSVIEQAAGLGINVRQDLSRAALWELTTGGGMMTAGVGGPFTGHGFDLLLIDDPIKNRQEAASPTLREHLWEWWRSTARTRLEPGGSIVVVMTRWHEDDLVGRLLGDEYQGEQSDADQWEHIRLPALAEEDDPLGRAEGEPLWPERYGAAALANLRASVGLRDWAGLFQQRPSELGGEILKLHWWRMVDEEPATVYRTVQFWDTAFKPGRENDYSCCVTASTVPGGFLVRDVWRAKLDFPALQQASRLLYEMWQPERVNVEDAASGTPLVQSFRRETRLPIFASPVRGDKVSRAHSITGLLESGRVFVPASVPWLPEFLRETSEFPNGAHDDQVDALVGALTELRKGTDVDLPSFGQRDSRWRERRDNGR